MRITNLIENTEGSKGCEAAHGLSFLIETDKHRVLMDLGPSDVTINNAEKLGIDLGEVDTVILSHGHYDHSGGIMPFSKLNSHAPIYMQKKATEDFFSMGAEQYRYIGIDKEIAELPQVRFVEGDYTIDDELSLFVVDKRIVEVPFTNSRLKVKRGGQYFQDDFAHEQALVVKSAGKSILLSGCAHNGIINILGEYSRKYGSYPDAAISGFHLVKKTDYSDTEMQEIIQTAVELKKYPTQFFTCHCTGLIAYEIMKEYLGEKLKYIHTGQETVF